MPNHTRSLLAVALATLVPVSFGCDSTEDYASPSGYGGGTNDNGGGYTVDSGGANPSTGGSTPSTGSTSSPTTDGGVPVASDADVWLSPDGHLVKQGGLALYFFANDVPGSQTSACSDACLDAWPAFDSKELNVGGGVDAADFDRFQRQDGTWQTTYKGRPLYGFAQDSADSPLSGDGAMGRWFVAKSYNVFVLSSAQITPSAGEGEAGTPFMTNGAGRAVYIFLNDTAGEPPTSACEGGCLEAWPVWLAPENMDDLQIPSMMNPEDFGVLERAGGDQLTYRDWPLYYYASDTDPGAVSGQSASWQVLDPATFAAGRTQPQGGAGGGGYKY